MFRQGNSFASVAIGLYEKGLKKSPYDGKSICPFIVNATFSIELYLKTIHNAYGNNIKGHSLTAIYKGMPKKGKEIFQRASVDLRSRYQLKEGWDIHTCLESINKAFEVWRYIYENNEIGVEIQSIRYAMNVSGEAALRVRESLAKTEGLVSQEGLVSHFVSELVSHLEL
jgi:hypothetical protein